MSAFLVTIRYPGQPLADALQLDAIGTDSCAVHMAMIDVYDLCVISVKPAPAK